MLCIAWLPKLNGELEHKPEPCCWAPAAISRQRSERRWIEYPQASYLVISSLVTCMLLVISQQSEKGNQYFLYLKL